MESTGHRNEPGIAEDALLKFYPSSPIAPAVPPSRISAWLLKSASSIPPPKGIARSSATNESLGLGAPVFCGRNVWRDFLINSLDANSTDSQIVQSNLRFLVLMDSRTIRSINDGNNSTP